jgi:Domain of unknown function (DUF4157)
METWHPTSLLGAMGIDMNVAAADVARMQPSRSASGARQVQQKARSAAAATPHDRDAPNTHRLADHGMSGTGGALPHFEAIQRSFGPEHDLSGVRAHIGGAATEASAGMGAMAYARGNEVAFGEAPSLHTAAHEAAHVVQQRAGVHLKGGVGEVGDSYERNADEIADRVVRGRPAGDLLPNPGGAGGVGGNAPVQHFKDYSKAGEEDSKKNQHWANAQALRVADDGGAAVAQTSVAGSQEMYVLASRLPSINTELGAVKAPLSLVKSAGSVSGATPADLEQPAQTLERVKPVERADPSIDKTIPDDCGNAARTVTGATAEGKPLKAEYVDKDGKDATTTQSDPEMMKYEIMVNHFGDKIPKVATVLAEVQVAISTAGDLSKKLEPFVDDFTKLREALEKATKAATEIRNEFDATKVAHDAKVKGVPPGAVDHDAQLRALEATFAAAKKKLQGRLAIAKKDYEAADLRWKAFLGQDVSGKTLQKVLEEYVAADKIRTDLISSIMAPYEGMSASAQESFDEKVGINRHANPGVGEAYTISSGGPPKSARSTWNFHWGGVIFKSSTGSDNITMENYAGNRTDEWYFQMYGVPSAANPRTGQTFHEQHRDVHAQHGTTPTTLSTEKP